jgi:ADP-ribose pyrophosphatase
MKPIKEPSKVRIMKEGLVWDGYLKVKQALLSFEKFDHSMTEPVIRESLSRKDAVSAVLWDPDSCDILLVRQFRYPTYYKGPGWALECVAGVMEEGETPERTIQREILEETGYKVQQLSSVMQFYPSPGLSDERITLFSGLVQRKQDEKIAYGDQNAMEDTRNVWIPKKEIEFMLRREPKHTVLHDAKTIIGLYWWLCQQPSSSGKESGICLDNK